MSFSRVVVLGLGKVGLLAAHLLRDAGFDVVGLDVRAPHGEPGLPVACGRRRR